jgi:glutamate-ammonia-ligase adenylyltransferase
MREIMLELSTLAESLIEVALQRLCSEEGHRELSEGLCILAFGKLGGRELNYSSDIDLLAVSERPVPARLQSLYRRVVESLRSDLADHLEDGQVYRVDLRLRPFGAEGELVVSRQAVARYYREQAALWELQALLKARPVAGNLALGAGLLRELEPLFCAHRQPRRVVESIQRSRAAAQSRLARARLLSPNIKLGAGGIRDVEFLIQGLQLIHAPRLSPAVGSDGGAGPGGERPAILSGNTLAALAALRGAGVLPEAEAEALRRDYLFLRRIEHYLQIFENRQTHSLPTDPVAQEALARRLLGVEATAEEFQQRVGGCLRRVEASFRRFLAQETAPAAKPAD